MAKIIRNWCKTNWTLTHVTTGEVVATGTGKVNLTLTAPGTYTLAVTGRSTETIYIY